MKYFLWGSGSPLSRRAPQGARGLKSVLLWNIAPREAVAPRKGRVG